jgi:hypothetical protein
MIRRACVLAGMLGLFLQGSTGGHMLLVEHSRCVEHGELVHNSQAHAHVSEAHAHANLAAVHATQNGDSDEAHEHCVLSFDRRDGLASVDASLVFTPPVDAVGDVGLTDAFVAPLAARFRIAPKNSPPA